MEWAGSFRSCAGQASWESGTLAREGRREEGEVKSAFTFLSGCNPRGKTVEVGLRGGKTGPKIGKVLTGWAASHVHRRASRTCHCLSGRRQTLRLLVEGRGPHTGSLGFHSLLAPRRSSPYGSPSPVLERLGF